MIYQFTLERFHITVMLNEVKHLYNTDSSLTLRMTRGRSVIDEVAEADAKVIDEVAEADAKE